MSARPPAPTLSRVPLGLARAAAARMLGRLERSESVLRLAVAGDVRRMSPWVERVDLLATVHEAAPAIEQAASAPAVAELLERADTVLRVRLTDGVEVRLEVLTDEPRFGAALLRQTGPADHVAALANRARERGLVWAVDRLLRGGVEQACPEESDVYDLLGLPWCPPERRGFAEVSTPPPPDLVSMADLRGVAGLHTNAGGGRYSLPEMAARAAREGYAWALAFASEAECDVWRPDPEAPLALVRAREIPCGNAPLVVPPGDEDAWVVAAPAPDLPGASFTPPALAAIRDPRVDVVLLRSPLGVGSELDVPGLVAALGDSGMALGIPPPPRHPEPEPDLLEAAGEAGIPVLLCADARDLVSLDDAVLVAGLARRAGLARGNVLNALDAAGLRAWRAARRARRRAAR